MQNKPLVAGVVVLILFVAVAIGVSAKRNSDKKQLAKTAEKQAMVKTENLGVLGQKEGSIADQEKDQMMAKQEPTEQDNSMAKTESETMMKEPDSSYVDYSSQVLADAEIAQKSGRRVVLFFHANWCPYCKAADKDFKANIGTDKFPKNLTLIKTDYDTQTELKKKYGVTSQHTFVQIDSTGNQITKWVSGETAELNTNIK